MDLVKWMKDTVPEKPLDLRSQTGPCVQEGLTLRVTREGGQNNSSRPLTWESEMGLTMTGWPW